MQTVKIILIFMLSVLVSACAGRNFNENNVLQLQIGITTPEQAESLLGEHYDSYSNNEGYFITWMYAQASAVVPHVKTLQLRFNNNVLSCVRVLSGFNSLLAEQVGLTPCEGTIKN